MGSQGVQSKCTVKTRLRKRSRECKGGLLAGAEDVRLLETCTWEMMRADRGTWDASVGLSELMRDSIFSASLLQASIWKEKTLLLWDLRASTVQSSKLQAYVQRKLARGRLLSSALLTWPESQVTMALTYYTYEGISGDQKLQCSDPGLWSCTTPHPACVTGCHSSGQAVTGALYLL